MQTNKPANMETYKQANKQTLNVANEQTGKETASAAPGCEGGQVCGLLHYPLVPVEGARRHRGVGGGQVARPWCMVDSGWRLVNGAWCM